MKKTKTWDDDGYFVEGNYCATGFVRQILQAYDLFGWDVEKAMPNAALSKILGEPFVDRGFVQRLLDYGYEHGKYLFPLQLTEAANFTALGQIAWTALGAPTMRHGWGTFQYMLPSIDGALRMETADEGDKYIVSMWYELENRRARDCSQIVAASSLLKFMQCYSGRPWLISKVELKMNLDLPKHSSLQDYFFCSVENGRGVKGVDFIIDADFASRKSVNFIKEDWERSKERMREAGFPGIAARADRYAQILAVHVANWNYQKYGRPGISALAADMKISDRNLRELLSHGDVTPKEVVNKAEAKRIVATMYRGRSMTEAAEMYHWSNVTNMKKMVKESIDIDIKTIKPWKDLDTPRSWAVS